MLFWLVMALMTGAAVMAVLWPLSRRDDGGAADGGTDLAFYRHQLREIDREVERKLLTPADAEAARTEAGRRLLRAEERSGGDRGAATGEPCLRRRRAAAALCLSLVPLIGLASYGGLGSPNYGTGPSSAPVPLASGAAAPDIETALARIEAHLAAQPDDARGWDVVAPVYLRLGRFDDAGRAFENAGRLGGETADRLAGRGEALVAGGGGVVSADAAALFTRSLALSPGSPRARFYLALAAEQEGDTARARQDYERLVAEGPADAPWIDVVRERLSGLSGVPAVATLDSKDVTPDIKAMVEGLDKRLRESGGTEPEWSRLVRAYAVLGEGDRARERLLQAKVALAADAGASARLDGLARDLGLVRLEATR